MAKVTKAFTLSLESGQQRFAVGDEITGELLKHWYVKAHIGEETAAEQTDEAPAEEQAAEQTEAAETAAEETADEAPAAKPAKKGK
jgi:hypothetical protein